MLVWSGGRVFGSSDWFLVSLVGFEFFRRICEGREFGFRDGCRIVKG